MLSPEAKWRSPELGTAGVIDLAAGGLRYFERGRGPTVVFVHGWLANANLWRQVVANLAAYRRCITLDMPLGAHLHGMLPTADLTPDGCGGLIVQALAALDLDAVTIVGNDSGGAYSQIATAQDSSRIAGLILNACETPYDPFPPLPFQPLRAAAQVGALRALLSPLKDHDFRMNEAAFGRLIKRPIARQTFDTYCLPALEDDDILADAQKVMSSAADGPVQTASNKLIASYAKPALFAWAEEDNFFPLENARRYASALKHGAIQTVPDAFSFTPEDRPDLLAEMIERFSAAL